MSRPILGRLESDMHDGTLCQALYGTLLFNFIRISKDFWKVSRFLDFNEPNVSGDWSADHSRVDHPFRFGSSFNHPDLKLTQTQFFEPKPKNCEVKWAF